MKKTQWIELLNSIKKTLVSFLAVAFIVSVSVALFAGMRFSAAALYEAVDRHLVRQKLEDMEIHSAQGITEDDLTQIAAMENVDIVEGGYTAAAIVPFGYENFIVQVRSLCEKLNQPVIVEGTLPRNADEVAVDQLFADRNGIRPGDALTLIHEGSLLENRFTVTAIINEPTFSYAKSVKSRGFVSMDSGAASYYVCVSPSAFNSLWFKECYSAAYIKSNAMEGIPTYSGAYIEQAELLTKEAAVLKQTMGKRDWRIYGRLDVGDVWLMRVATNTLEKISSSMSLIFLFVAVVICYAYMVRMIDEQRILIGAQKALGFTPREILRKYLYYGVFCSLTGIIVGLGLAAAMQCLIVNTLSGNYLFTDIHYTIVWGDVILVSAVYLAVFITATCAACIKMVHLDANVLLKGELPARKKKLSYENRKLYRSLSLYSRVIIKNLVNDKGRILVTISGCVGCVILLIISISLKSGHDNAPYRQFERYFHYDTMLYVDSRNNMERFDSFLDSYDVSWIKVQEKWKFTRASGGRWSTARVVSTTDTEALGDYMTFMDTEEKHTVELPEDGVLISRKFAENNALHAGMKLDFMDNSGNTVSVPVAAVIEHYLPYNMVVMAPGLYESIMGEAVEEDVYLLKECPEELMELLPAQPGYLSLSVKDIYFERDKNMDMIIMLCIILSAMMAFLVLLNQSVVHIRRKTRELSVMRINGFTLKETRAYIYRDNIILTAAGLLIGNLIGLGLSYMIIQTMEGEYTQYVRDPNPSAFLFANGIAVFFAVVVNVIALRKVKKINMTYINEN